MSPKKRKNVNFKNYKRTTPAKTGVTTEKELKKKLVRNILGLLFIGASVITGLMFLGPQIGTFIGWATGNTKEIVRTDNVPPSKPIFVNPPTAVKDEKVKLDGFAEAGSQVKLFVNGPEKMSTTADNNGEFTFTDVELIKGGNTIFAKAYDSSNNESEKSNTLKISVDEEKPEIKINSPKGGDTIENLDKRITIKGEVNEKATLTINDRFAVVRPDLTFEFVLGVEEGNVEIKVKAIDEAGNENEEKITVTYKKG